MKLFNDGVKRVKKESLLGLRYVPLDRASVHLRVYTDASLATNDDLSSQLEILILLYDSDDHAHIIDYRSHKSRRVVRSIMVGEVAAFMEGFDHVFSISRDHHLMLGSRAEVYMFTDFKQLFDALTKGKETTERRLMIEIMAARQAYRRFEIDGIGLVRGEDNPADGLSKVKDNGALRTLLTKDKDKTKVVQWIERSGAPMQTPSHWKAVEV